MTTKGVTKKRWRPVALVESAMVEFGHSKPNACARVTPDQNSRRDCPSVDTVLDAAVNAFSDSTPVGG